MGGCRCVYRSCQSSTSVTPGLHYFHFPVKDKSRCDQWIANAHKQELHELSQEKLRNKVVCSLHFELRYFTNEKQDRLVHNAIPTLGHEDDPLYIPFPNDAHRENVQLIAMDEDNTKFTLPDVEFSGKSYMIYNDNVVPTVKEPKAKQLVVTKAKKNFQMVIKKKIPAPVVSSRHSSPQPAVKNGELTTEDIVFKKTTEPGKIHAELKLGNLDDDSIPSYSMSELNGDLSLKLNESTEQPMIVDEEASGTLTEHSFTTQLPPTIPSKKQAEIVQPFTHKSPLERPQLTQRPHKIDSSKQLLTQQEIYDIIIPGNENQPQHELSDMEKPRNEKQYIQMIQTNTKQIKTLKRLVQKQSKMNRFILQRKQMPNFKPRKMNKSMLLESLKDHLKPSLLAILKLEMLPVEDVVLTDSEEKFIMDLYVEHPECYDLLRNKFNWNLPSNEVIAEANDHDQ